MNGKRAKQARRLALGMLKEGKDFMKKESSYFKENVRQKFYTVAGKINSDGTPVQHPYETFSLRLNEGFRTKTKEAKKIVSFLSSKL